MSYDAFLDITPGEFYLALKDESERKKDEVDAIVRMICETIREQTLILFNIQLEQKDRIDNSKKLFAFPWEEQEDDSQTKEEMINTMKAISKGFIKKKK